MKTSSRKILSSIVLGLVLTLAANAQVTPGVGANTEDPKKVLLAAERAIAKLHSAAYSATYEGTGSFSTRTSATSGRIRLEKLPAGDPLTARLAAEGYQQPAGNAARERFAAAFNGKTILRLNESRKIVTRKALSGTAPDERSFGFVTGLLGGPAFHLLMYEFLMLRPFEQQMTGDVIEYEGRAAVGGVLCHVIYVEFGINQAGAKRKQRWYFGTKNGLPLKVEDIVTDDKGRDGAYVLTITDLQANIAINRRAFSISLPKKYKFQDYKPSPVVEPLAVGDMAPQWALNDASGISHALADYRGQIVVLDFWATWCGPCVRFMPGIQALHDKFKERGVKVFGVNAWEEGNAAAYFQEKKYTYGLLLNGEAIAHPYRVSVLPHIYVIGTDGRIIFEGIEPGSNLIAVIERHLKENGK
jgi:thiol-disulfide isomerase/thioredoxin